VSVLRGLLAEYISTACAQTLAWAPSGGTSAEAAVAVEVNGPPALSVYASGAKTSIFRSLSVHLLPLPPAVSTRVPVRAPHKQRVPMGYLVPSSPPWNLLVAILFHECVYAGAFGGIEDFHQPHVNWYTPVHGL